MEEKLNLMLENQLYMMKAIRQVNEITNMSMGELKGQIIKTDKILK